MDERIQLLFFLGGASFLTWWFLLGLLNPYLEAFVAIVITAFVTIFGFFLNPIIALIRAILHLIRRILTPVWVKIPVFTILGAGILILDHLYNTKIFAEDQTMFYRFIILGKKYWITSLALMYGGFFLGLAVLYLAGVILKFINRLLDRPLIISIVVQK